MAGKALWGDICSSVNTCALTGATAFFAGIPNAHIVINGPSWCYFYALRYIERADSSINNRCHNTQLNNKDIVYGTKDNLLKVLNQIKDNSGDCSIVLAQNSCAVGLIGDDIEGITKNAQLDCPIVTLDSGGVLGGLSDGYVHASMAFFEKFPLNKNNIKEDKTVNLIGATKYYLNGCNDLKEIKRLLLMAGYKVNVAVGVDSSLEDIKNLTKAELNIVIHPELGLKVAQFLESEYDMPFIVPGLPYGVDGTRDWFFAIDNEIKVDFSLLEEEIQKTEHLIFSKSNEIKSLWGDLWFDKIMISAPFATAFGVAKALRNEWADTEELTVAVQDNFSMDIEKSGIDKVFFSFKDSLDIERALGNLENGLLLASSIERSFIDRKNVKNLLFSNIAYPTHDELFLSDMPFMGINGHKYMLERLWNKKIEQKIQNKSD